MNKEIKKIIEEDKHRDLVETAMAKAMSLCISYSMKFESERALKRNEMNVPEKNRKILAATAMTAEDFFQKDFKELKSFLLKKFSTKNKTGASSLERKSK